MNNRIVVCCKCGSIYDLHYIDNVRSHKNHIDKFECKHCGLVDTTFSGQFVLRNEIEEK